MNSIHNRIIQYLLVAAGLTASYLLLSTFTWQGSAQLHTVMEVIATLLAIMVGGMALVKYYTNQKDTFLIIGTGFLGTGFLDGYHLLVTSIWSKGYLLSELPSLIPWSWIASRLFLSMVFFYSCWHGYKKQNAAEKKLLNPTLIFIGISVFTLVSLLFFAFVPLPSVYYPDSLFHRPEEWVPALFFTLALIGYLGKGDWRESSFEHWLIIALIVNLVSQTVFMSNSGQLFDMEFDAAHVLKIASYLCVMVGFFVNMYGRIKLLEKKVAQRKKIQAALANSESRYRSAIDAVLEGIITINERGQIATMNPAAENIFGYRKSEVIGENVKMLMPEPYHSEHDGYLQNYLTTHVAKIIGIGREVQGKRKNGSVFPMELAVSEMQIDGRPMFTGLVRDITERKLIEQELSNSRDRLALATRAGGFGVWDYNVIDGSLIWDERMFQIYGINKEHFVGAYETWQNVLHPDDRERAEIELVNAAKGVKDFDTEFRIVWPDKSVHTLKASALVLRDTLNNAERIIGVNWDITQQKEIDNLKNEFISTVSHELRTPLTSIQGSLELILSGTIGHLPEEFTPLLQIANNNSSRLVRLINDILDVEKIESGKMEFKLKPVNMMSVVHHSIEAIKAFADEYDVKLVVTSEVNNCLVIADSDRLIQILTNLLSNAVKFSPKGQAVEIGVAIVTNSVRVSVTDYGAGIPDEFKERIFTKFSQADASSTKQQGGTGLGLSICKAIIEKLGGHIDYESEAHKKTSFYFDIPVFHQKTTNFDPEKINKTKDSILICEDDPNVAELLKLLLEKKNYEADIAFSAEQAKQMLLCKRYAAMTLDLLLPNQSGSDFFKELRQTPGISDIPVIVVSAFTDKGKADLNGQAISVYDWLDKPIDPHRLESAVNNAIKENNKNHFRILHIEDDLDVVMLIKTLLKNHATIEVATDIKTANQKLQQDYDLVILDLKLPDGSGSSLLSTISQRDSPIPVIVFSAQENTEELEHYVRASFVKSKTSNADLIRSIELILNQQTHPTQELQDV